MRIIMSLFAAFAVLFLLFLFWKNQRVEVMDVSACDTSSAQNMTWEIEKAVCQYNYVTINGYAYENGVSLDHAKTTVLVYDPTSDIYYKLPTENVKKTKITEKAADGYNYDYAEFQSVALLKKIPSGCQIFILYQGNEKNRLIATGQQIVY